MERNDWSGQIMPLMDAKKRGWRWWKSSPDVLVLADPEDTEAIPARLNGHCLVPCDPRHPRAVPARWINLGPVPCAPDDAEWEGLDDRQPGVERGGGERWMN